MYMKMGIGQDSHRFADRERTVATGDTSVGVHEVAGDYTGRLLKLGGVVFEGGPPLAGNSDADVVLHALCNAVSGVTGVNILGETADRMCLDQGITDSAVYVKEAMKHLAGGRIVHASFSIECARPVLSPKIVEMRKKIAEIAGLDISCVGVTATSGEGLTDFGRGLGIQAFCVVSVVYE